VHIVQTVADKGFYMKENFELPGFMTAVSLLSSAEALNRAAAVASTEEHAQRI